MTKKNHKPYLLLLAALLLLMSLSTDLSEKARGLTVSILSPIWKNFQSTASLPLNKSNNELTVQKLQIENRLLYAEVARLQELLQQESTINLQAINLIQTSTLPDHAKNLQRHNEELDNQLDFHLQAIPAQVIFRSPSSWNSSLWLNVGTLNNSADGKEIISKNSPVVVGNSVIGVIDYIGEEQCRVRLITDSGLSPCVRAIRGDPHKRMVSEQLSLLMNRFNCYHGLFKNQEEKELMIKALTAVQNKLSQEKGLGTWYLAKGELHGSSQPLWRSRGSLLKGVGFNYDFADEEGPARDLRTGIPENGSKKDAISLLQLNDLLVTTGMDGVFPPGLYVAEVTKIHLLKEGDFSYELEAKPTAGDLQELSTVFVLPPLRKDKGIKNDR